MIWKLVKAPLKAPWKKIILKYSPSNTVLSSAGHLVGLGLVKLKVFTLKLLSHVTWVNYLFWNGQRLAVNGFFLGSSSSSRRWTAGLRPRPTSGTRSGTPSSTGLSRLTSNSPLYHEPGLGIKDLGLTKSSHNESLTWAKCSRLGQNFFSYHLMPRRDSNPRQ